MNNCASNNLHQQPRATAWQVLAASAIRIPEPEAEARLAELKAEMPSRASRRMSRLGLMLSHLIGQTGVCEETTVLYASQFAEGRTLETYLSSFPQPSPLGFQSSIHPGGVEQALIYRQQSLREFFPISASDNLPLALFRTLQQCAHAQRVLLLGGEESATWLADYGLAADETFAFALLLEPAQGNTACLGSLSTCDNCTPQAATAQTAHNNGITAPYSEVTPPTTGAAAQTKDFSRSGETLYDLCMTIEDRNPMQFSHPDEGCWQLHWHEPAR